MASLIGWMSRSISIRPPDSARLLHHPPILRCLRADQALAGVPARPPGASAPHLPTQEKAATRPTSPLLPSFEPARAAQTYSPRQRGSSRKRIDSVTYRLARPAAPFPPNGLLSDLCPGDKRQPRVPHTLSYATPLCETRSAQRRSLQKEGATILKTARADSSTMRTQARR